MSETPTTLTQAIMRLLRPLVRLLLRQGISFNALSELLKRLYVEVAEREFGLPGRKQSVSRISTLTGLSRKEVARAMIDRDVDLAGMTQQYNRAARVISGWVRDGDFHNQQGQPAELEMEQGERSFKALVRRYSGDIPPRAIADELIRVGAAIESGTGALRLIQHAYVPEKCVDEKLRILGTDVRDLIETISHNIYRDEERPYFQRKVSYNAIPAGHLPGLRSKVALLAQGCLEEIDRVMVQSDSDMNPEIAEQGGCRAGLGIYYFEGETDE